MPLDRTAKRMIIGIVVIVLALIGAAAVNHLGVFPDKERDCRARGEKYFKEIGSWPKLSDGSWAIDVARERCARTTTAFDGI